MINKSKSGILKYLCIFIAGVLVIHQLVSCGKEGTNLGTANAYLNIVNLSPNINPVNLYTQYIRQTARYTYPNASGYFLQNIIDTPLQLRPALTNNSSQLNLLQLDHKLLKNVRYTWFITGLRSDSSFTSIFTTDSGSVPAIGRAKIRLVNASPGSAGLNLAANDSVAFTKVAYKDVTDYIEITAGAYNFVLTPTATPKTILKTLANFTVLDGKLYTIYTYGLPNRTDTAAFNAGVVLNTIPDKN